MKLNQKLCHGALGIAAWIIPSLGHAAGLHVEDKLAWTVKTGGPLISTIDAKTKIKSDLVSLHANIAGFDAGKKQVILVARLKKKNFEPLKDASTGEVVKNDKGEIQYVPYAAAPTTWLDIDTTLLKPVDGALPLAKLFKISDADLAAGLPFLTMKSIIDTMTADGKAALGVTLLPDADTYRFLGKDANGNEITLFNTCAKNNQPMQPTVPTLGFTVDQYKYCSQASAKSRSNLRYMSNVPHGAETFMLFTETGYKNFENNPANYKDANIDPTDANLSFGMQLTTFNEGKMIEIKM